MLTVYLLTCHVSENIGIYKERLDLGHWFPTCVLCPLGRCGRSQSVCELSLQRLSELDFHMYEIMRQNYQSDIKRRYWVNIRSWRDASA